MFLLTDVVWEASDGQAVALPSVVRAYCKEAELRQIVEQKFCVKMRSYSIHKSDTAYVVAA